MKKGYWVVSYRTVDQEALKRYAELAVPAIGAGGGKVLIRTADAVEPREAGLKQRVGRGRDVESRLRAQARKQRQSRF